jgi:peroxiredoxin
MVLMNSLMVPIGTPAPDFRLPDTAGRMVSLADFKDAQGLLVMFLCNHCPYVKHIRSPLAAAVKKYQAQGISAVGINSNDVVEYPEDSPEKMKLEARQHGYTFPYLFDETQAVARAYRATCTPDLFLFDGRRHLHYRGQFDSARPGNQKPVTGEDLTAAVDGLLAGKPPPARQMPSAGCNIKWKSGEEPEYFRG